ncbi:hypothetical protein [Actinoplanes sp. GCM10030250]|uniref:hypothetical protein n=1 Tax=Actinoplanes sp. GCM10030250 TaxID=3273376 RepID=UPI0036093AB9
MTSAPGQPDLPDPPERTDSEVRFRRVERRREKVYQQVQQAKHGRHWVPTWLLAAVLGLLVAGWLYLIITS